MTVPALAGVNLPSCMAVTPVVPASFTVQTMSLFVALSGVTAAEPRSTSAPAAPLPGTPEMPVTGTNESVLAGLEHPAASTSAAAIRTLP